jgi:glycosyltransferase involved in cell wall biosynthesis
LAEEDIRLHLIHGEPSVKESMRKDIGYIDWAHEVRNKFLTIKGVDLIWQPLPSIANTCDLLVLMQENRIISNYPKILKRKILGKKIGYWGHGKNLQSSKPDGLKETWKKLWLTNVTCWFAYTKSTVDYLEAKSFPSESITCLNNAIDVNTFKRQLNEVTSEQLARARADLGITANSLVGIFCGSLYAEKRLGLLLESIDIIKNEISNFVVIIIGDGPDAEFLKKAALSRPWLHLIGVKKGPDKALHYRLATVMLNPGLVGLHILDSFCAGVPMITTKDALHSPEFDYLEHNINGLVTDGNSQAYADSIIDLLADKHKLDEMKKAALNDGQKYTVEAMAINFCAGIIHALESEKV